MRTRFGNPTALALLVLATTVVFLPSLEFDFLNWDDVIYIHDNPWLRSFSLRGIVMLFEHDYNVNYHPLTMVTYLLEFQLFGLNPTVYHATNLLLHLTTVVLLFVLLRRLNCGIWASYLLAQLFAVHPLRIESVVWISQRKDILCSLFYVAGLVLWVTADKSEGARQRQFIGASLLAFLLAALSKAMAVSFPIVVLIYDTVCQRDVVRKRAPLYTGMIAIAVFFSYLNLIAQAGAIKSTYSLFERFKIAAYAPLHYARMTIFPHGLSGLYPIEFRPTVHSLPTILGILFCLALATIGIAAVRRRPQLTFGILSAGVVFIPVSGIITVGGAFAADRYTYLPTVLLLAGLAPIVSDFTQRTRHLWRFAVRSVFLFSAVAYALVSLNTIRHWSDSSSFWRWTLTRYPKSGVAKRHFADALSAQAGTAYANGQVEAAYLYTNEALEAFPADCRALHFATQRLAASGLQDSAEQLLTRALNTKGIAYACHSDVLSMLSAFSREQGDSARADSLMEEAFSFGGIEPVGAELRFLAGLALSVKDTLLAIQYYEKVLEAEPVNRTVLFNLGLLYGRMGNHHRAFSLFHRLTQIYPDDRAAHHNARASATRILGRDRR